MTSQPFGPALTELLEERSWSIRRLSRETRKRGRKGLSHGAVGAMARGDLPPTREALEILADALLIKPEHFSEYRLEVARDRLNWRVVGVKRALRALGE